MNRFVKVLSYCNAMNVGGENFTTSSVKLGAAPPFTLGHQMNLKCLYCHYQKKLMDEPLELGLLFYARANLCTMKAGIKPATG